MLNNLIIFGSINYPFSKQKKNLFIGYKITQYDKIVGDIGQQDYESTRIV